jgi:hypothetical protein
VRSYEKQIYSKPPMLFATDEEIVALSKSVWIFDIELFENFLLIAFKCYDTGQIVFFEQSPAAKIDFPKLAWMTQNLTLVGFNSKHYDQFILWATLANKWTEELKAISDSIIYGEMKQKEIESKFNFKCRHFDHIDLQQVAPAAAQQLSLKHYGARMHSHRLQELPLNHNHAVSETMANELRSYCINDLDVTGLLYHKLKTPIQLRTEMSTSYKTDLRSSSDAQIAEKAIGAELQAMTGIKHKAPAVPKGETFRFNQLAYLDFQTPVLRELRDKIYETDFVITTEGKVEVLRDGESISAKNLWKVTINKTKYKLGIGGLHSEEKKRSIYTDDTNFIFDRDVASYYPAIILNQGLYPHHIGRGFLDVYRDIYERRLAAKKAGDKQTSESLKICINGCFGKLGSRWSIFYSPHLLVQVTLSGQLSLLLLIESLELAGIPCMSANTDGVVILCPRDRQSDYLRVVAEWEKATAFVTEETPYLSVHSRDVNNYIAICMDGKVKAKGVYVNSLSMGNPDRQSLMSNPTVAICSEAVMRFLQTHNKPNPTTIEQTIKSCTDIRKFLSTRRVNGGAVRDKVDLGKVVRWYIRKDDYGAIYYKKPNAAGSTNKVAETDGAMPLMELPEKFPDDIDYSWYIRRAHSILKDVGYYCQNQAEQLTLF